MSENSTDSKGLIIFGFGVLFIIVTILVLFGMGKYTKVFKEKAVDFLKETAPGRDQNKELDVNSADAPYLKNTLGEQDEKSDLDVGNSGVDYGFKMDVEKAAQQQDAIEKYSIPSVPPGQPGSKEWQEQFWKDR